MHSPLKDQGRKSDARWAIWPVLLIPHVALTPSGRCGLGVNPVRVPLGNVSRCRWVVSGEGWLGQEEGGWPLRWRSRGPDPRRDGWPPPSS